MKFIEVLLNNSTVKEAKLYNAAKKAAMKPDTGVIIQNPSAFHVIKDCAMITNKYLPHYIFGQYPDPFQALKGKFTKADIQEFLTSANSDFVKYQLLLLILEKIDKKGGSETTETKTTPVLDYNTANDDPYGDYGYASEEVLPSIAAPIQNENVFETLCQAFGAV